MRALWKQVLLKERQTKHAHLFEPEEAYDVMRRVVDICDNHLCETSLEYLAATTERMDIPPNLTLGGLHDDLRSLKGMFLQNFGDFNQPRKDLLPTKNELILFAMAMGHYCTKARSKFGWKEPRLRMQPAEDTVRDLLDARIRLGAAMCTHKHMIRGLPYETAEQRRKRRDDERLDKQCPSDYTIVEWEDMREKQRFEEEKEAAESARREALIRQAVEAIRGKKRKAEWDDDSDSSDEEMVVDEVNRQVFPDPDPYPETGDLWDEVSYFLACYWVEGGDDLKKYFDEHKDVEPSQESVKIRDRLTNSAKGGELGGLWSGNAATNYLLMASSFFSQVWTEEYWRDKYPMTKVSIPVSWQEAFTTFICRRLELQQQDDHIKSFTATAYENLMCIGGRALMIRTSGARGVRPMKMVYKMNSVFTASEINEMIDTEAGIRLIGYDPLHPLYDALTQMQVDVACMGEDADFDMASRCMVQTSDLVLRGKAFDIQNPLRRPLITKICGQWMVHHPLTMEWVVPYPNNFRSGWMTFLSLLKEGYNMQLDDVTDLSYWEKRLNIEITNLPRR